MEEQRFPKPCVACSTQAWGVLFLRLRSDHHRGGREVPVPRGTGFDSGLGRSFIILSYNKLQLDSFRSVTDRSLSAIT